MARTRDAASVIFYGASARELNALSLRTSTFDAAAVQRAVLRALTRDVDEEHPGAKFVQAGCKFLHDDLHPDCGAASVTYSGRPLSMQDAGEVMTGLGYEMTGRTAVGATYEHPDKDGGVTLVPQKMTAKDRRVKDDDEASSAVSSSSGVPSSSYGGDDFMASMQRDADVGQSMRNEGDD